jgi:hypothetical protein
MREDRDVLAGLTALASWPVTFNAPIAMEWVSLRLPWAQLVVVAMKLKVF